MIISARAFSETSTAKRLRFAFLKNGIRPEGILIYETFLREQRQYGRPHNPDFLLKPGELADWFQGWQTIYYFEGILDNPTRAVARIVCRKPH